MAILNFQKPDKVIMIDSSESHGKFEFRPLEPGYGLTIGNALRRVLLSSLEGYAFTSIKIDGVDHEFSTIEGVVEDVTEIILNIKQIRLKRQIDDTDNDFKKYSSIKEINDDDIYLALDNDAILDAVKISNEFISNGIEVKMMKFDEKDPSETGFSKLLYLINRTTETRFSDLMRIRLNGKTKRHMEI